MLDGCLKLESVWEMKDKEESSEIDCNGKGDLELRRQMDDMTVKESPLLVKVIDALGLRSFFTDYFIFAKRNPNYKLITPEQPTQTPYFKFSQFSEFKFNLPGYEQICQIIDTKEHFIPVVWFKRTKSPSKSIQKPSPLDLTNQYRQTLTNLQTQPQQTEQLYSSKKLFPNSNQPLNSDSNLTIIYSHGNCSNLQNSYEFVTQMIQIHKYECDFIIYDYTEYGDGVGKMERFQSSGHKCSEDSIKKDLIKVLQWSKLREDQIVLWGFSLGCCPTISVGAQLKNINGIVLQSPFASIFRYLDQEISCNQRFRGDMFENIANIDKIQSNLLIIHSRDDQVTSIWHSRELMKKYQQKYDLRAYDKSQKQRKYLKMIQLKNFSHSNMHQAFYCKKNNRLQQQLVNFLQNCSRHVSTAQNVKISKQENNRITESHNQQQNFIPKTYQSLQTASSILTKNLNINHNKTKPHKKRKINLSIVCSSQNIISQSYISSQNNIQTPRINIKTNSNTKCHYSSQLQTTNSIQQ